MTKLDDLAFELETCFSDRGTLIEDGKRTFHKKYRIGLSYKGRHIREVTDEMEKLLKSMPINTL